MKKNKIVSIIVICFLFLLIVGCDNKNKDDISVPKFDNSKYNTKGLEKTTCVRNTDTESGTDIDIEIELYSDKDGYLQILKTKETVKSTDKETLKEYHNAYKKVFSVYENMEYYDNTVENTNSTVTSTTYINYGKIDIDKLIEIEGTENNVKITDGKVKLSDWKDFAKKYGTTCSK